MNRYFALFRASMKRLSILDTIVEETCFDPWSDIGDIEDIGEINTDWKQHWLCSLEDTWGQWADIECV
jgi:hypothetical protein